MPWTSLASKAMSHTAGRCCCGPPPPGPSPPAPPRRSPLNTRGSYSGGTPRCSCCRGRVPRVDGDVGVGELGPTLQTRHHDAARRHCEEVSNLRDTFREEGLELLEERPPDPRPQGAFALSTPEDLTIPCLIFTPHDVEKQLQIFCDDFFVAAAPRLHHLLSPHLAIPCSHSRFHQQR